MDTSRALPAMASMAFPMRAKVPAAVEVKLNSLREFNWMAYIKLEYPVEPEYVRKVPVPSTDEMRANRPTRQQCSTLVDFMILFFCAHLKAKKKDSLNSIRWHCL